MSNSDTIPRIKFSDSESDLTDTDEDDDVPILEQLAGDSESTQVRQNHLVFRLSVTKRILKNKVYCNLYGFNELVILF